MKSKNKSKPSSPKITEIEKVPEKIEDTRTPLEKKTHKLLKNNGMLDGYKYVLANICKDGLPQGDIFEYSAYLFQNYEKKWKALKSKEVKEKIMKYKEEKQKSKIEGGSSLSLNNSVNNIKAKSPSPDKNEKKDSNDLNKTNKTTIKNKQTKEVTSPKELPKEVPKDLPKEVKEVKEKENKEVKDNKQIIKKKK